MNSNSRWTALGLALAFSGGCGKAPEPVSPTAKESGKETTHKQLSPNDGAELAPPAAIPASDAASKPAGEKKPAASTMPVKPDKAPDHVKVQHILISFHGAPRMTNVTRTKEEAQKLAREVFDRARAGEDFLVLVKEYTDDSPPGIYGMANNGVTPAPGERPRTGMVPAFGNVGFAISPGNIDMAEYDAQASPFGWHIIKRLE